MDERIIRVRIINKGSTFYGQEATVKNKYRCDNQDVFDVWPDNDTEGMIFLENEFVWLGEEY
jgi:hypothetical protein